jgi:rod shape-determining protein MreC
MDRVMPNLKLFLILCILSIFIFVLDSKNFLSIPKSLISFVTNPVSSVFYKIGSGVGRQFYFVFQARFASQENKALKEQMGKLLSENATLRKKLAEAESLISQGNHLDFSIYNMEAAHPIGISRYLKIDKGSSSGLKIGQAVVFNENLIGRIIQISSNASSVQFLKDPDSKVAAFSQGLDGKAKGVLVGQFGSEMLLDKILHEEKINIGDLVYSEGTEGNLPRGLILGKVTEVLERENEVFKQAKILPNFDIRDLELVFVITE